MAKKPISQLNSKNVFRPNVLAPLTSFIGRERELAEVTDSLARTRLLTLIGAGGWGQKSLPLQLAEKTGGGFSQSRPGGWGSAPPHTARLRTSVRLTARGPQ